MQVAQGKQQAAAAAAQGDSGTLQLGTRALWMQHLRPCPCSLSKSSGASIVTTQCLRGEQAGGRRGTTQDGQAEAQVALGSTPLFFTEYLTLSFRTWALSTGAQVEQRLVQDLKPARRQWLAVLIASSERRKRSKTGYVPPATFIVARTPMQALQSV